MSDSNSGSSRRRFGLAALFAAVLVGLVGGGIATSAVGGGFGPRFAHWGGHRHGPIDPTRAQQHAEHVVGHLAWAIDATPDQRQKLTTIATALVKDLMPAHEKMRAARGRAVQLLRAPQTDRAALEALRAEQMALADDLSKRVAQGLADAADVLTPQQRAKLAQHWTF